MSEQLRMFEMPADESSPEESEQIDGASAEEGEEISPEALRAQPHLEVYKRHVLLAGESGTVEKIWAEGKQSAAAQERYKRVIDALTNGFLDQKIEEARSPEVTPLVEPKLPADEREDLEKIVSSVTAQNGRALVDVFVLQLAIKAICPEQDIRLHKGSVNRRNAFSWKEGISMRRLDDSFIGPSLRKYDLLRMNQYGAFMTRTFAENYPYTLFYKAEITGAKQRWLNVIDSIEDGNIDAETALLYVLQLLWKSSEAFVDLVHKMLASLETWLAGGNRSGQAASTLIKQHIERSEARARLLEVAIHALLQALEGLDVDLGGSLKPLMPMRTANLKHGNIGDVEVLSGNVVVEAWDAKYDQPYLLDALDELIEKIRKRDASELQFGYVLLPQKKAYSDVDRKVAEIADLFGMNVQIVTFDEWVREQFARGQHAGILEERLAQAWLRAYAESLGQKRRTQAPIDEPTFDWVKSLLDVLSL
jgi:hypothetical protein